MVSVQNRNNINTILDVAILASATTIVVKPTETNLFPDMTLVWAKPFYITLEKWSVISGVDVVTKREIALCTNRVWNILTVTRWADFCVQDDSADPKTYTNNPLDFSVWDVVSMRYNAKTHNDLQAQVDVIQEEINNPTGLMDLTTDQTVASWVKTFTEYPRKNGPYVPTTDPLQLITKQEVTNDIVFASTPKNLVWFPVMAGENLANRDTTFIEEYPTFAESTVAQNIGDVAANTRVSAVAYGSWVSGSSAIVKLEKTGTPTPAFEVRYVNEVSWAPWDPIADLVNPNAVWTINQNTILVPLALWWSWVVWWATFAEWFRFTALTTWFLNSVNKAANCTGTICFVINVSTNTVIEVGNFVWNTATFLGCLFMQWQQYDVLVWSWTPQAPIPYTRSVWSQALPLANVNINVTTWSNALSWPQVQQTNITDITTSNGIVNFAWSFMIPKWQKVYQIFRQVWDVVNPANYYRLYWSNKHTSTRLSWFYNGTSWNIQSPLVNGIYNFTWTPSWVSVTWDRWIRFTIQNTWYLWSVTYEMIWWWGAVTKIKTSWWVLISNAIWNTQIWTNTYRSDFSPILLIAWTEYRIETSIWWTYTTFQNVATWLPQTNPFISITGWSINGANNATTFAILSINSTSLFIPTTTTIFENQLLSKTDIDFAHKTNLYWLATQAYTAWQDALVYKDGEVDWFVWLTTWARYYLSSTPWLLTTIPNPYYIWYAKNTTTLIIPSSRSLAFSGSFAEPNVVWPIIVTTIIAPTDWFLIVNLTRSRSWTAGTHFARVDFGWLYVQEKQVSTWTAWVDRHTTLIPMRKWQSYPVTVTKSTALSTIQISWARDTFISLW